MLWTITKSMTLNKSELIFKYHTRMTSAYPKFISSRAYDSATFADSKFTASFLCFFLEVELGVWPVDGGFCLGGVWAAADAFAELDSDGKGWLFSRTLP